MNSTLIMQPASRPASRSIAPNYRMAWVKSAQTQLDVHGVDVAVPAFTATAALPAAVRTRGAAAPLPRGIPV